MAAIVYNLAVISIFAVLSYKLNQPLLVLCAIFFLMKTVYYDGDGEE